MSRGRGNGGRASTALDAARRARELSRLGDAPFVDVLVVGGGVTGAAIALDAASRGLRTVLVERHDLAFGTSRWSSKLVHGGLRYLASGQFGIAHESAAERHVLMTRTATHLTRPLRQVVPLYGADYMSQGAYVGAGFALGDGMRRLVGTPAAAVPPPAMLDPARTRELAQAVAGDGLRGAVSGWDGQVIDDARLVVALCRTAAGEGASILTRVEAREVAGDGALLVDTTTGAELRVGARAVLGAAGVWTGLIDPAVRLRPSRGTHLVVETARLGGADVSLTVPVPGATGRFVFTVPAPHGRTYIGLTDVPLDADGRGAMPDVPHATDAEIDELLVTMNTVLADPLDRHDVIGTFAGLRPLLDDADDTDGARDTDALSRRHAILESSDGVLSVVGGKLTTARRMAQDGVDEAVRRRRLPTARTSRTAALPLVGAWPRDALARVAAPPRWVRRYGAEAPYLAALPAGGDAARGVTAQELEWGVRVEGALSVADLLDRRTRLGLVATDAAASVAAARAAFDRAGVVPLDA